MAPMMMLMKLLYDPHDADLSVEEVAQFALLPHVFSLRRRQLLVDLALLEHDLGTIEQLEAMSTPVVEQSVPPPAVVLVQQRPLLMLHLVGNIESVVWTCVLSSFLVVSKKDIRRTSPILRPVTFLVAFGVVLVAPRTGWCVIVDVRVASPLAKPASTQSQ